MCTVAAAPLLFDDPPIASPELALVDADLAAQLRGDLSIGEAFRPRAVPRPESPSLAFDAVVRELADEQPPADEQEEPPVTELDELPEYDELPDYIVRNDDHVADLVPDDVVLSRDEPADVVVPAELEIVSTATGEASFDDAHSSSDYPVLPDLDERRDALDETDAALRRIREQMGVTPTAQRTPRVRRRFTVCVGVCAAGALAAFAADVQLGVAHVPGWLGF
jgi:hypothetical protein